MAILPTFNRLIWNYDNCSAEKRISNALMPQNVSAYLPGISKFYSVTLNVTVLKKHSRKFKPDLLHSIGEANDHPYPVTDTDVITELMFAMWKCQP
ncbi:hypothetical protein AVEN_72355-1 [Araneus ventricosus]|uniref:Uncharacterized protein n=1 Tax=Araneus ventricosus TaxID=182803 RepID=A0A4Y2TK26_ARAVE|nr:hypothetical protein AVEN_72355-1 [Araneus ventricosus]